MSSFMLALTVAAVPTGAHASPSTATVVEKSAILDAAVIRAYTVTGQEALASSENDRSSAAIRSAERKLRERVQRHLAERAQSGHYLDASQVKAASIPNPLDTSKNIDLVWSGERDPGAVRVNQRIQGDDGGAIGVNVTFNPPKRTTRNGPSQASATAALGSGFEGATSHPNMYSEGNDCYTVWFNPTYSSVNNNDHQMNTCWEIWAQDKTVHFIYNRWALWTIARPARAAVEANTVDFSILSRPWKTRAGDIEKINKSTPAAGSTTCTDVLPITIGGAYGGTSGQITIPVHRCETTWIHFDRNKNQFGIDWDGSSPNQLRLDAAGDYNAINKTVLPVWADQTFAAVEWCNWDDWCVVGYDENWKYQDSGW